MAPSELPGVCSEGEVLQLWGLGGDSRYEIGEWLPNRP